MKGIDGIFAIIPKRISLELDAQHKTIVTFMKNI